MEALDGEASPTIDPANGQLLVEVAEPWGGFNKSGYGHDSGRFALEKFLQTKAAWTNLG